MTDPLAVTFSPDGHQGIFGRAWLAGHLDPARDERTEDAKRWRTGTDFGGGAPVHEYPDYQARPRVRADALGTLLAYGFIVLRGVPCEPGAVLEVAGSLGFVRETNYGRLFDVQVTATPCNLAYTGLLNGPATEGPAMTDPVSMITGLFASEGAADYLGEPVTQAAHMLQAAALAERDGAPAPLIAAALLHDVGHFTGTVTGHDLMRGTDNRHSEQGASWLARWFGPEVTEPVRLHVDAKRYLCATEPGYLARLSPASVYTLGVQGGPMTGAELAAFEARPHAAGACRVRRWDDAAKDPGAGYPPLGHFVPLLRGLVTD